MHPISNCQSKAPTPQKRLVWRREEIKYFIELLNMKKKQGLLDHKRVRLMDFYSGIESGMREAGFIKTEGQLHVKFKNLKAEYYKCKRNNADITKEPITFEFYDMMDDLLDRCVHAPVKRTSVEWLNEFNDQSDPLDIDDDQSTFEELDTKPTLLYDCENSTYDTENINIVLFSQLVQQYLPEGNKEGFDPDVIENISWQQIAQFFNSSVDKCKTIWKNLGNQNHDESQTSTAPAISMPEKSANSNMAVPCATNQSNPVVSLQNSIEKIFIPCDNSSKMQNMIIPQTPPDAIPKKRNIILKSDISSTAKRLRTTNEAFGEYIGLRLSEMSAEEASKNRRLISEIIEKN